MKVKKIKLNGERAKSNAGRPPMIDQGVIDKLEEVFMLGGSDAEACLFADISTALLYKYQNENPGFVERKESLKETPVLKARRTLIKATEKPFYALEFLKRRKRKEFGDNVDLTSEGKVLPTPIYGGLTKNEILGHNSNKEDLPTP